MAETNNLIIDLTKDYTTRIEDVEQFEESFFSEIYYSAATQVEEILIYKNSQNPNDTYSENRVYNNIIAFVGDRGTGKSSSMMSFCKSLVEDNKSEYYSDNFENIAKSKFFTLGMIDPSSLHVQDNLLEIVISKMFKKFREDLRKPEIIERCESEASLREIKEASIKQFQEVFNNLKFTSGNSIIYKNEAIDSLSKLAYGLGLKESFTKLVDYYLGFMSLVEDKVENSTVKNMLLIEVDDFDLNIDNSYQMLEDMRKNLITNNVVVIIACKIQQLISSVEENIREEYKNILNAEDGRIHEPPTTSSNKYLEKLIPEDRRLFLPEVSRLANRRECNITTIPSTGEDFSGVSVEEFILNQISSKLGLYIRQEDRNTHSIVPKTLRELINDYKFYSKLQNNGYSVEKFVQFSIVKDVFGLKEFDSKQKMKSKDFEDFIRDFDTYSDVNLNKRILFFLKRNAFFHGIPEEKYNFLFPKTIGNSLNYSIGDVSYAIQLIDLYLDPNEKEEKKFVEALRLYYNLRTLKKVYHQEDLSDLLGGSIMCPDGQQYLRESRGHFVFDYSIIRKLYSQEEILIDDLLWIYLFISQLGKPNKENNVRTEKTAFWGTEDRQVSGSAGKVFYAKFSFLDFLPNAFRIVEVARRMRFLNKIEIVRSSFYKRVKKWCKNNKEMEALFLNLDFIAGVNKRFESYDYKEGLPSSYSERLHTEIKAGVKSEIEQLESQPGFSNYIKRQEFKVIDHPAILYWEENSERLGKLLNQIYDSRTYIKIYEDTYKGDEKSELISMIKKVLDEFVYHWIEDFEMYSEGGLKQSVMFAANRFKPYPEVYTRLLGYRKRMDNEDNFDIVEEINGYLASFIDE